ncbi:restriction endonuclease, SacI family [Streptomyces mirabilis]|uniref:restriction endonuclease, SacI family n=1 Tax=Streptomyces mirabilis TaxID=68239 RepID=UPI002259AB03|nr:restriction endonuclease, SacI family [Streptomyces mirabilis]MCX4421082.1 restriction endonuclease, SacI family [Streptomyces mirabilis]
MGIRIDKRTAAYVLRAAFTEATEANDLPEYWIHLAQTLREEEAPRTYTPALCVALLARACNEAVDPLSIKDVYSDRTYSHRTLAHGVLVPLSVELGFDLKATGREPLNNQPFFRYDHYSEIERIQRSARPYFERLQSALQMVDTEGYTRQQAQSALAAVLTVCIEANRKKQRVVSGSSIVEASLIAQTEAFVTSGADMPRKLQACVAAALDMTYPEVASRRLNDPSRDFPGDVHALRNDGSPLLAVEVRGKPVTPEELEQFVRSVTDADIPRAALVVHAVGHRSLLLNEMTTIRLEQKYGRLVKISESVSSFMRDLFVWSSHDTLEILSSFPDDMYKRMSEIEVRQQELDRWANLFPDEG